MTDTYTLPTANSQPGGITLGPDGALWFTESATGKIGRITTAGVITEYTIPSATSPQPSWITTGPDGALWFTENNGNIGRVTTAGVISQYGIPGPLSSVAGITTGPDGEIWFAESSVNKISEAVFETANLTVSPGSSFYHANLTFTGSGFAPSEKVQIYLSGVGSAVLASGTTDSSGSLNVTATAPQSPYGPRLFLGVGQTSGKLGAASFSVKAKLILNPTSGLPGNSVTAQGYGFGSFEQVNVFWDNPRTALGKVTTNVNGTFNSGAALTFSVPAGASAGNNSVFGVGQVTGAMGSAPFNVQ